MIDKTRWGILGTGGIARIFAAAVAESASGQVVAVGSRHEVTARAFAGEFGIGRAYGSYTDVLDDPSVEIVYVATPHNTHVELAVAAARAGKHILCEKPLAVNAAGARVIVEAARRANVFLMEAFAFRVHPQTRRLAELLEGDEIGELRSIHATFGFDAGPAPTNYLLRPDLAGGAMLDNGCYPVSLSRRIAGHTVGRVFRDPDKVVGVGVLHPEHRVDLESAALTWYEGGITAQLMCTIRTEVDRVVVVTGSRGIIRLPAAYLPGRMDRFGGAPRILVERFGEEVREVPIDVRAGLYTVEADAVVAHVREGRTEAPEMSWEDSIGNMETLDRWRAAVGVSYEQEVEGPPGSLMETD